MRFTHPTINRGKQTRPWRTVWAYWPLARACEVSPSHRATVIYVLATRARLRYQAREKANETGISTGLVYLAFT